ncbi:Protein of unknown function [Gryllus bimaculatus]|nr:Protein of unknown function [Gryllus bimaculatus]
MSHSKSALHVPASEPFSTSTHKTIPFHEKSNDLVKAEAVAALFLPAHWAISNSDHLNEIRNLGDENAWNGCSIRGSVRRPFALIGGTPVSFVVYGVCNGRVRALKESNGRPQLFGVPPKGRGGGSRVLGLRGAGDTCRWSAPRLSSSTCAHKGRGAAAGLKRAPPRAALPNASRVPPRALASQTFRPLFSPARLALPPLMVFFIRTESRCPEMLREQCMTHRMQLLVPVRWAAGGGGAWTAGVAGPWGSGGGGGAEAADAPSRLRRLACEAQRPNQQKHRQSITHRHTSRGSDEVGERTALVGQRLSNLADVPNQSLSGSVKYCGGYARVDVSSGAQKVLFQRQETRLTRSCNRQQGHRPCTFSMQREWPESTRSGGMPGHNPLQGAGHARLRRCPAVGSCAEKPAKRHQRSRTSAFASLRPKEGDAAWTDQWSREEGAGPRIADRRLGKATGAPRHLKTFHFRSNRFVESWIPWPLQNGRSRDGGGGGSKGEGNFLPNSMSIHRSVLLMHFKYVVNAYIPIHLKINYIQIWVRKSFEGTSRNNRKINSTRIPVHEDSMNTSDRGEWNYKIPYLPTSYFKAKEKTKKGDTFVLGQH